MKFRLVVSLAALAALPIAWFVAGKLHRFAYWIGRKTDAEVQALAKNGWSVERLDRGAGVTLVGLVRAPLRPDAPWILFAPGNSSAQLAGFQAELDAVLAGQPHGVAFFAYRGFEASSGTPAPEPLADDLLAQWRWLRARGVPPERIEIWGYSLGSVLATRLAAAVSDEGETPARLVLVASSPRIPVMRHGALGRFLPDDEFVVGDAHAAVRCPIVMVHGEDDDALPVAGARLLHAAFGTRATLEVVPQRGHVDLWPDVRRLVFTAR